MVLAETVFLISQTETVLKFRTFFSLIIAILYFTGRWNHIENLDEFFIRISFLNCIVLQVFSLNHCN